MADRRRTIGSGYDPGDLSGGGSDDGGGDTRDTSGGAGRGPSGGSDDDDGRDRDDGGRDRSPAPAPAPEPEPDPITGSTTVDTDSSRTRTVTTPSFGGIDNADAGAGGSGQTSVDAPSPAPTTPGGLGAGDAFAVADDILSAERNPEIVDRATTGGFLSERGESAGLAPPELSANTPEGEFTVDTSETRLREGARAASRFGDQLDIGAITSAQAALVEPIAGDAGVSPSQQDLNPTRDPETGQESAPEEFIEGGVQTATNLPGGLVQSETAAETAQAAPGLATDFSAGEIAETGAAVGRDRAAETAAQASASPAEFAGAITTSAALGAGAFSRGSTGGLGTAVRAELDPRIGAFGTNIPTRAARGAREFLRDDRGQADLSGLGGRDGDTGSTGGSGGLDDDLQDALDTFESQGGTDLPGDPDRLDPRGQEFDTEPDIDAADPVQARREQARQADASADTTTGALGLDERPVGGTRVDPTPDRGGATTPDVQPVQDVFDTSAFTRVDADASAGRGTGGSPTTGASVGGLLGTPGSDGRPATGTEAGGLLGTPGAVDSTGTTADVGGDLFGGGFGDMGAGAIPDGRADVPGDTRTDAPTDIGGDSGTDTRTDIDQPDVLDADTRIGTRDVADVGGRDLNDPRTRDPERDPGRDPEPTDTGDVDIDLDDEGGDDDEAPLFGTQATGALVDSGILSGRTALDRLFGR